MRIRKSPVTQKGEDTGEKWKMKTEESEPGLAKESKWDLKNTENGP